MAEGDDRLRVGYEIEGPVAEAAARGEAIAREQTVEVPAEVVRDAFFQERVVGRVESVVEQGAERATVTLSYPAAVTAHDPAQLLNVIFGNTSLQPDVRCVDVALPDSIQRALGGPRFGAAALYERAGVRDRALTCTAIKPMGLDTKQLADLCEQFARAGIDVVKDDHGLAEQPWSGFEARVAACLEATRRAAEETGREALYVPNLIGSPERVRRALDLAQAAGARAVMAAPMLIGLPCFWELATRHSDVPVLAHPAFGGALRIAPEVLFGTLLRAYGADAVIFVSFGSRFRMTRAACTGIADALRTPRPALAPSLPVPAGGIRLDNAAEVARFYGPESMLLVGGDLQVGGESPEARARRFVAAVAAAGSDQA